VRMHDGVTIIFAILRSHSSKRFSFETARIYRGASYIYIYIYTLNFQIFVTFNFLSTIIIYFIKKLKL
jgi:hypothetical protein